jgi:HK97 family phage major capsid protein
MRLFPLILAQRMGRSWIRLSLTGSGSGQMTGLLNVSGISNVSAGSSVAGMVDGVVTGYQTMVQNRFRKPNVCIMHPRRWLSGFANAIDLQGRPLMLPSTHPAALVGTADDGVAAEWLGMKVILDQSVPTTSGSGSQDYIHSGSFVGLATLREPAQL